MNTLEKFGITKQEKDPVAIETEKVMGNLEETKENLENVNYEELETNEEKRSVFLKAVDELKIVSNYVTALGAGILGYGVVEGFQKGFAEIGAEAGSIPEKAMVIGITTMLISGIGHIAERYKLPSKKG